MNNKAVAPLRIVLVDDSEADRLAFSRAFKNSDIKSEITFFTTAEEALELLLSQPDSFDIVISDYALPDLNGLDFLKAALDAKILAPLVLLTGSGSEKIAIDAFKAGIHNYIIKDSACQYLDVLPDTIYEIAQARHYKDHIVHVEEALEESDKRYRTLVELLPDAVVVHTDRIIVYANQAALEIMGVPSIEKIAGKSVMEFVPDNYQPVVEARLGKLKTESVPLIEAKFLRLDGTIVDVEVTSAPLRYLHKNSVMTVFRDITTRKTAERELLHAKEKAEKATREKDKYISLIAHDLKAPFTSIVGFMRLILSDQSITIDKKFRERFHTVLAQSEDTVNMIDEILLSSRFNTGRIKLQPEFIDGYMAVFSMVANYGPLAREKGVELVIDVPKGVRLYVDPPLFGEVLQNLTTNAIKFCNSGDTITFFAPSGAPAVIALKDTGVGIDQEMIVDLFRYDVKTAGTGTAGEKGTGLGLPLCQEIMKAHGGRLEVESEVGVGTVIYARLPNVKPIILLVDDEDAARYIMGKKLDRVGAKSIEAQSGVEALKILEEEKVHLILLDIIMPGMDGFEVLRRVKEGRDTQQIPVIMVTSDDRIETRDLALQMGAEDFISKPVKEEELIPRVRKFTM
ncbi:hypothetical protein MNBD_NITROSPINAE02-170 [hydrothermal vent metagenome]|uniref:Histidine kinase n=1 Tax=hydrothermal vent metagenome TaxID=652676 RepID=A0A3B1CNK6_9ZZZZ